MTREPRDMPECKLSFLQTLRTVAWGFFGVRKGSSSRAEAVKLNPVHLIIAGILSAAIFVIVLVSLVRWVLSSAV